MRRESPSSMQVLAGGKFAHHSQASSAIDISSHGMEEKRRKPEKQMHEMKHLEDRFHQELEDTVHEDEDIVHQEPEKEYGYFSDQPYGAIVTRQVATVTGDVKSGLHDSCSSTKARQKAAVQCCSMSLDAQMAIQMPERLDPMTFVQAEHHCDNEGMRLCTKSEFHAGRVKVEDATVLMWTSDDCDLTTAEGQKFLKEEQHAAKGESEDADKLGHLTYVMDKLEKQEAEMQEHLHEILIKHAGAMESAKLPFTVYPEQHLVELKDYNLVVRSSEHKPGTGNLVVGLGHDVKHADNGFVAGEHNTLLGTSVSVAGGIDNQAVGKYATVLGGDHNAAAKPYSTVAGGSHNTALGRAAEVGGGSENLARGLGSVVAGGLKNRGFGKFGVVAAGLNNTASGMASTVLNGRFNEAAGSGSGVAEGQFRINAMSTLGVS